MVYCSAILPARSSTHFWGRLTSSLAVECFDRSRLILLSPATSFSVFLLAGVGGGNMLLWLIMGESPVLNLLCSDKDSWETFARFECDCLRVISILNSWRTSRVLTGLILHGIDCVLTDSWRTSVLTDWLCRLGTSWVSSEVKKRYCVLASIVLIDLKRYWIKQVIRGVSIVWEYWANWLNV